MKRILASIILLISILFCPFWVSIVLAVLGLILFHFFFEGVALMFLSDLLYGAHTIHFGNSVFIYLIAFALLLILIEFLKVKMKFTNADSGGSMGTVYKKL